MIPSFRRRFSQPKNNLTTSASNSLTPSTNRQLPNPTATLNTGPSPSVVDKSLGVPPSPTATTPSVNSSGINSSGVNTGPSSIPSSILNIPINSGQLPQPVMGPDVAPTQMDWLKSIADKNESQPGFGYQPGTGGREGFLARGGNPLSVNQNVAPKLNSGLEGTGGIRPSSSEMTTAGVNISPSNSNQLISNQSNTLPIQNNTNEIPQRNFGSPLGIVQSNSGSITQGGPNTGPADPNKLYSITRNN